jgi:ABC-2 type transport system permease protein
MSALLRAEVRKLLSTRSFLVLAGLAVTYPALALLPAVLAPEEPEVDASTIVQILRGGADVLTLAALILGVLAVAGEYRHGTVVPSLLVAPRRERWVGAKLGSQTVLGAALGLGVGAVGLLAGGSYLSGRGVSVDPLSGDVLLTLGGMILVAALYATLGTAVGALVRNPTAAVAGVLIWDFAVENALPLLLRNPGLGRWLPGGAADRLLHLADPVTGTGSPGTALVMFAGLAAGLAAAAVLATRAADVH